MPNNAAVIKQVKYYKHALNIERVGLICEYINIYLFISQNNID